MSQLIQHPYASAFGILFAVLFVLAVVPVSSKCHRCGQRARLTALLDAVYASVIGTKPICDTCHWRCRKTN